MAAVVGSAGATVPGRGPFRGPFVHPDQDPRDEGGFTGERDTLVGYPYDQRLTFQRKCAGLDAAPLALQSLPPSTLSLLGLVRHATDGERAWFRRVVGGRPIICYR